MNTSVDKLASLRAALRHYSLDAYLIPLTDPHLGENITDHWSIVKWLTGFTGSAGTLIITETYAGLWTDSRYFIQAGNELSGTRFELIRPTPFKRYEITDWLYDNLGHSGKIAFDGRLFSISFLRKLENRLKVKNIALNHNRDLITEIWNERPEMPSKLVYDHPVEFSGQTRSQKITFLRELMKNTGAGVNYHLLTSPDDIMWLLNIRGSDYTYSPLISSFAIAGEDQILLFADKKKFPVSLAAEFDNLGIVILPVEEVIPLIHRLPAGSTILINPERTSVALYNAIPSGVKIDEESAIPERLKAVKNSTEIRNIGQVMLKDGVALTRFYYWIESNLGRVPMSEMSLSVKLKDLRSIQEGYIGNSFQTIVAYNDHGALPHYTPSGDSDHVIGENGMLLIDSGAHYFGGTTDITRTISLGTPSHKQKRDFTLVLKGHINLAMAKFPEKTRGYQLDILARKYLWENGLNYGHGTGHGVGYCLNVHEGPQSISPAGNKAIIEPGMLVSNEPAIYREGEYGIRTENLMICYEDEETDFGKFMKFDTVSLCYIDRKLIDKSLLNETEINWLNSYHTGVYEKISPFLNNNEKKWLWEKTSEL